MLSVLRESQVMLVKGERRVCSDSISYSYSRYYAHWPSYLYFSYCCFIVYWCKKMSSQMHPLKYALHIQFRILLNLSLVGCIITTMILISNSAKLLRITCASYKLIPKLWAYTKARNAMVFTTARYGWQSIVRVDRNNIKQLSTSVTKKDETVNSH